MVLSLLVGPGPGAEDGFGGFHEGRTDHDEMGSCDDTAGGACRRRRRLAAVAFVAPASAQKTKPIKVAAIYTVPVEQQWVSRIHKALNAAQDRGDIAYVYSENVANTDYERVMREYAEQGNDLIFGEVFGVEQARAQVAADYPEVAFLMGSSLPARRSRTSRSSTTSSTSRAT